MNQSDLERAVARATGESRSSVKQFGFSLVDDEPKPDDELTLAIDCPGCGAVIRDGRNLGQGLECPRCDAVYPVSVDELYVVDNSHQPLVACADHFAFSVRSQVLRAQLYALVFHQQRRWRLRRHDRGRRRHVDRPALRAACAARQPTAT